MDMINRETINGANGHQTTAHTPHRNYLKVDSQDLARTSLWRARRYRVRTVIPFTGHTLETGTMKLLVEVDICRAKTRVLVQSKPTQPCDEE